MHKLGAMVILLGAGIANADDAKRSATVTYGAPIVTGTYATKALTAAVKKSHGKYLACYNKARRVAPELEGTANATFTIAANGKVTNVAVSGLGDAADKCVAGVVAKLKLAKPTHRAAVEVTYPLSFSTVNHIGAFASLTGGDFDTDLYGGLVGDEAGEPSTGQGLGGGSGRGGGGTGWGTIGIGRYSQIGSGSGTGTGYGTGFRGGRASATPTISIGQPNVVGDLDQAIIRRYIKRNVQRLQYCYERELASKPTIQGTVTLDFTIGLDGRVKTAVAAGVDTEVEACVAGVVKGLEFPKPKGASEVTVQYPLTYRLPAKAETKTDATK